MIPGPLPGRPLPMEPVLPRQSIATPSGNRSPLLPSGTATEAPSSRFGRVLAERRALAGPNTIYAHPAAAAARPTLNARAQGTILSTPGAPGTAVADRPEMGTVAASVARRFLGDRYVWGGHSPGGFDCTGLTWYVYRQLGVQLPMHDLAGQYAAGRQVPRDQLREGDLVFFRDTYQPGLSHVGIALGGGSFLHALSEQHGVTISRLDEPYWSQRYSGATRPSIPGGLS